MIDSHVHFWNYHPVKDAWINDDMRVIQRDFSPLDLQANFAETGISGCVAVQADQTEDETHFLLAYAEQYEFVKGVVGWIDLKAKNLPERLAHFAKAPYLKGWRHVAQSEPTGFLISDDFLRGIAELQQYQHTYDILIYQHQLNDAITLVDQFPTQKFVLDHLAKPNIKAKKEIELWRDGMKVLSQHKNLCVKVSGMVTEADWNRWKYDDLVFYLDTVFEYFGPQRLMFGSDWPVCTVAADYRRVKQVMDQYTAQFDVQDRKAFFEATAVDFYNL